MGKESDESSPSFDLKRNNVRGYDKKKELHQGDLAGREKALSFLKKERDGRIQQRGKKKTP